MPDPITSTMTVDKKAETELLSEVIGRTFDLVTETFLRIFDTDYLNFGLWLNEHEPIQAAQARLVDEFGRFSKLDQQSTILDAGFGTGAQDFRYFDLFQCERVVGINVSAAQVRLAQEKLAKRENLHEVISFKQGDALHLAQLSKESFNRVLALESGQLFLDKRTFFEGARHVLKSGGCLCLAEPIILSDSAFADIPRAKIEAEWPEVPDKDRNFCDRLHQNLQALVSSEISVRKSYPHYGLLYPEYLKVLRTSGFQIEEIRDITCQINFFYPHFKRKMKDLFVGDHSTQQSDVEKDVLMRFLSAFYWRDVTFRSGAAGYFLIRAS